MKSFTFYVTFEMDGLDAAEASRDLMDALHERIDGHLLSAQRTAHVRWLEYRGEYRG